MYTEMGIANTLVFCGVISAILCAMALVISEESSWKGQIQLLVLMAGVMQFYIPWFTSQAMVFMGKHPMREQYIDLNQSTAQDSFGVKMSRPLAFEVGCWGLAVMTQHCLGGLLCIPSRFSVSWLSKKRAAMLARLGGLTEAGWELQDLSSRFYAFNFGGKEGRDKNPVAGLIFLGLHHALGLGMVIPMNVLYGDSQAYHEMIFNMQFCSMISNLVQQYGYTLDTETSSGLWKKKLCSLCTWMGICYSRAFRFIPLALAMLTTVRNDGRTCFFFCSCAALGAMGVINALYLFDSTKKVLKFVPRKHLLQSRLELEQKGNIKAPSSLEEYVVVKSAPSPASLRHRKT